MPHKNSAFHIRIIHYRSGSVAHEVSGMLGGKQIRKRFKTLEEAETERQRLTLLAFKAPCQQLYATTLTPEQIRQAEAGFTTIDDLYPGLKGGLTTVVLFFVKNYKEAKSDHTVLTALEVLKEDMKKQELSSHHQDSVCGILRGFHKAFPNTRLHEFEGEQVKTWLENKRFKSNRTWNNVLGTLNAFFNWALKEPRQWVPKNPLGAIARMPVKNGTPQIIDVDTSKKLMTYVERLEEGRHALHFALLLFAGIRSDYKNGEIHRLCEAIAKPNHEDFFTKNGKLHLTEDITKTGYDRWIDLQENLKAWIRSYPPEQYLSAKNCGGLKEHYADIRRLFSIPHNAFRKSFISYTSILYSIEKAAEQAGHGVLMSRKHYINQKFTKKDARAYFSIFPSRKPEPKP